MGRRPRPARRRPPRRAAVRRPVESPLPRTSVLGASRRAVDVAHAEHLPGWARLAPGRAPPARGAPPTGGTGAATASTADTGMKLPAWPGDYVVAEDASAATAECRRGLAGELVGRPHREVGRGTLRGHPRSEGRQAVGVGVAPNCLRPPLHVHPPYPAIPSISRLPSLFRFPSMSSSTASAVARIVDAASLIASARVLGSFGAQPAT
jgi:hypothetical protein